MTKKEMMLHYTSPAPTDGDEIRHHAGTRIPENDGWEKWSLPIGCGYFGANVFGRTDTERVQITENSLVAPLVGNGAERRGGLANFAELYLDLGHTETEDYRRFLSLDDCIAGVSYRVGDVRYEREYFASYPDRVLAVSLTASKPGALSFTLRPEHPFGGEDREETYTIVMENKISLGGVYGAYRVHYEAQFALFTEGGEITPGEDVLCVTGADRAYIIASFGTDYRLNSRVFTEHDPEKKIAGNPHPHLDVMARVDAAASLGLAALRTRHMADCHAHMGRVTLDLGGETPTIPTDALLRAYREGAESRYLEALYFQYGRYLLFASARPGTLPPNLQGTWNRYDSPPWGSGYWHNINIQMNYWGSFSTGLAECFDPYVDYCRAYMPEAERFADSYIGELYPDKLSKEPGGNGWAIGTSAWPYVITPPSTASHSGPGTGAFTTMLFWDAYAFSGDVDRLRRDWYPPLKSMARFLLKTLVRHPDGTYLVAHSASPEQYGADKKYYRTVGCAFDQSMVWECFTETLAAAALLGDTDALIGELREILPQLDPVSVGADGQIREYREETHYGEIGEWHHRHISHLVGLYPGTLITRDTPALLAAAKHTLELRGDKSTGWAMAHRLCAWARTGEGDRTHAVLRQLLASGTMPNLWDTHPPFQIDGNYGGSAGIAEMLLQSHGSAIDLLPCLPAVWHTGTFAGLCARGGFTVSASWTEGQLTEATVTAAKSVPCRVRGTYDVSQDGEAVDVHVENGVTVFDTDAAKTYMLTPRA